MSIVTTVSALGDAETEYDLAHFSLSFIVTDTTVPAVKVKLKEQVAVLEEALELILASHDAKVWKNTKKTSFNILPKYEWINDNNVLVGYQASYSVTFQTDAMDKINNIYDELSVLHNIGVTSPTFSLKNVDRLNKKALKDAWGKVSERFEDQCSVFGKEANDYEPLNWQVEYSDVAAQPQYFAKKAPRAALYAADDMAVPGNAPIAIASGNARVSVTLSVAFKKKD